MGGSGIAALVFGVILTAVAFAHPIGPALMLAAETPFDAIPFTLFGTMGNAITYVPVLIFLIRVNPSAWGQVFFGTRIQQYVALFFMALVVSHAMTIVDKGVGQVIELLRKLTLFLLMAIFAYSMRGKYLALLAKTMAAAMAVFVSLAMLDFYLGIQLMPVKGGQLEAGALEIGYDEYSHWRFTGAGLPVNRFSNYILLPIFLGVGWFMSVRNPFQRALAFGCTGILILGELFTVTRSGILGMVVGLAVMLPLALRLRVQQVLGVLVVGGAFGALVWYGMSLTSADAVIAERFDAEHLAKSTGGRLTRIVAALKIWAEHPFFGVGWSAFKDYSGEYISVGGTGAHNAYMNVLAEAGLLGFIPLMILTVVVVRRSLTRVGHISTELEFWRPYFFCGLLAQLVTNVFNDYLWERYLWVSIGFCVALEQCYQAARAKQARARLDEDRRSGAPSAEPVAARPQLS